MALTVRRTQPGKDFEAAVFEFYRSRDPAAEVLFDHKVKDLHTGEMRQADVWIKSRLIGDAPYYILVSCKDHRRPLTVGAIEQFSGEILSYQANKGVLYSRASFSKAAIKKANALGIDCCCLYKDKAPDNPSEMFVDAFVSCPGFVLMAKTEVSDPPDGLFWRDILFQTQWHNGKRYTIRDLLAQLVFEGVMQSNQAKTGDDDPTGIQDIRLHCKLPPKVGCPPFKIELSVLWHWHRGRMNAYKLSGSMTKTRGTFEGEVAVAAIPMLSGADLGIWERCPRPEKVGRNPSLCFTLLAGLLPGHIEAVLGDQPVFGNRPWVFDPPPSEVVKAQLLNELQRGGSNAASIQMRVEIGRRA